MLKIVLFFKTENKIAGLKRKVGACLNTFRVFRWFSDCTNPSPSDC